MGHKKDFDKLRTQRMLDKLEYETARKKILMILNNIMFRLVQITPAGF
ncbi:MAG: hypothetical protein H0Z40_07550 [Desulfotomaculum sp.]|nr:hypothetical protein [Desulfotomaculum sp.]